MGLRVPGCPSAWPQHPVGVDKEKAAPCRCTSRRGGGAAVGLTSPRQARRGDQSPKRVSRSGCKMSAHTLHTQPFPAAAQVAAAARPGRRRLTQPAGATSRAAPAGTRPAPKPQPQHPNPPRAASPGRAGGEVGSHEAGGGSSCPQPGLTH